MDNKKFGRGELLLKYAVIWEWSFVVATLFFGFLIWFSAREINLGSDIGIKIVGIFLAIAVFESLTVLYRIKRRNTMIKNRLLRSSQPPIPQKPIDADEKIVALVPSAMELNFIQNKIPEFRSIGPAVRPQNCLVITNKHILFLYAPLFLGDQVIDICFVGGSNWKWANKEISQSINSMLTEHTLSQVYDSYSGNFSLRFDEIKAVKFFDFRQTIIINSVFGKSFATCVKSKEDYVKGKATLANLGFGK